MKGNENKKAFISFHFLFRIGAFQRVTADSNKKVVSFACSLASRPELRRLYVLQSEHHSRASAFQKANVQKFRWPS
jgi:hypothetical protein